METAPIPNSIHTNNSKYTYTIFNQKAVSFKPFYSHSPL